MLIVSRKDDLTALPMGEKTRQQLERFGIHSVGELFDAPEEVLASVGQARRLVKSMAEGKDELGLLEWGMELPAKKGKLYWSLEGTRLTIYGNGRMMDYTEARRPPWEPYAQKIRRIDLDEGVENVGARAFEGLTKVDCIRLWDIDRIGFRAFADCTALTEVHSLRELCHWRAADGDGVRVGQAAFDNTPWVRCVSDEFFIEDGLVLKEYFEDAETVVIPEGVVEIAPMVFEGKRLKKVVLPKSLKRIGTCAFRGTGLQELVLPKSLEEIDAWAFADNPELKRVVVGNSRMYAEPSAFRGTPVEQDARPKGRFWQSVYGLNQSREEGLEGFWRLGPGVAPERRMGTPRFSTRQAYLARLRQGDMLLKLTLDRQQKRVKSVQAIAMPAWAAERIVTWYPCEDRQGRLGLWREDTAWFDRETVQRLDLTGLRQPGDNLWYAAQYRLAAEDSAPAELLKQWLRQHPDYRVDTWEECTEGGPARAFCLC